MSRIRRLIHEVHRRSLWQVLGIYLVGAAVAYQLIEALVSGLGLPEWFPPFAVLLFIIGLPIVLATAFVQEGIGGEGRRSSPSKPGATGPTPSAAAGAQGEGAAMVQKRGLRRLLTWRNALTGGALAFGLWGVVATSWLLTAEPPDATSVEAGADGDPRKVVAVLPFANMSDDPENEFFTAGIHDDILSQLAKIRDLTVISRTSVMQYADTEKPIREIAEELGAGTILEGSVRRAGEQVRVVTQLIDAEADAHLWSETYDRALTVANVFAIQSEIAGQIAKALKAQFSPEERERIESAPTVNLDAYDFYLRGNDYFLRPGYRLENFRSAQEMLERAVELDPAFALAHARLSEVHSRFYWWSFDRTAERLALAREAVDRALELDPELPEAHLALGWYYYWGHLAYDRALAELAIAERGLPGDAELQTAKAAIYRRQGNWEAAVSGIRRAAELDPRNSDYWWELANTVLFLRRYSEAERYFERALAIAPEGVRAATGKAYISIYRDGDTGPLRTLLDGLAADLDPRGTVTSDRFWLEFLDRDYAAALEVLAGSKFDVFDFQNSFTPKSLLAGYVHRAAGKPDLARAAFDSARDLLEAEMRQNPDDPRIHASLGQAYAGLERRDEAVRAGLRATQLHPMSKDLWTGPGSVLDLAHIYVLLGERDAALEQLDRYLSAHSAYINRVLLDPRIDPLRDDRRFQALVERYRDGG